MNITELIVEYLKEGHSVEITGIGTLKCAQEDAHLDSETKTYYPGREIITYSNELAGDSSIINLIAEKECVNGQIAQMMWHNYVDALTDKLERSGSHTFPGIGDLCKTANGFDFKIDANPVVSSNDESCQPIEHINTYTTDNRDPFAVFEKPAEPSPVTTEPQKEAAESPSVEPVAEPQPTPEPIEAEATIVSDVPAQEESIVKTEEKQETTHQPITPAENDTESSNITPEPQTSEPAQEPTISAPGQDIYEHYYNSYHEPEQEPASPAPEADPIIEEPITPMTDENVAKEEISSEESTPIMDTPEQPQQNDQESVVDIVKQLDKMPAVETTQQEKPKKKKKRGWIILLIILLVLLLGAGGGYYYYFIYLQNPDNIELKSLLGLSKDSKGENKAEELKNNTKPSATNETDDGQTAMINKMANAFSFNTDLLEFNTSDIENNSSEISNNMSEYIDQFLSSRHYSKAKEFLMQRIDNYSTTRLGELFDNSGYSVMRFFNTDTYLNEYLNDVLKSKKASRSRAVVQKELMDYDLLDELLNEVIDENELQAEDVGIAATKKAPEPKVQDNSANTHFETSSKQGYDIIAGFYTVKSTATQLTAKLKSLGCDAYIIDRNGLYYVSMGSAPTQTAADALYKHIKSWYEGDIAIKKL